VKYLSVLEGVKKIYADKIRPVEQTYQFADFYSPLLRDSDFEAKPMVLLLGQYSTGKTSFIRYMLEGDFPGAHIGPEPTTDRFMAIMHGPHEMVIPGNALAVQADKPFRALSKFGNDFLNKFSGSFTPSPILEDITFIDTPGVLSGEKQRIGRSYDFVSVCEWFAARADLILLLFDAHKLDISDEFKRAIEALKGQEDKIKVALNKADMVNGQQLMRVYGALMWSLGKVLKTPEVVRVYIGSFWEKPYQNDEYAKLFDAERNDLLKDLFALPRMNTVRKINELVKRARLAKVHAYIISHLRNEMPMIGKKKKQDTLIETLSQQFLTIYRTYQLPPGDFPQVPKFQEQLKVHDFAKFAKLNPKLIEAMDTVLAEDIPKLMKQFPQEKMESLNPFEKLEEDFVVTVPDRVKAFDLFNKLGPVDGKISGKAARGPMMESGLGQEILKRIWVLSDRDKDGSLSEEEFAIAITLVRLAVEGKTLPKTLPEKIVLPPLPLPDAEGGGGGPPEANPFEEKEANPWG